MEIDSDSLERLVPDRAAPWGVTGSKTLALHLQRYAFALEHAKPGRLLDAACGVGYGTRLLSDQAPGVEAHGLDISEQTIAYARKRYGNAATHFTWADALRFNDPEGFDTIVSLETIEHVPDPPALVAHLLTLLRPGGVFVASVPTTPTTDVNPHHLHDFTQKSFRHMVEAHGLEEIASTQQVHSVNPLTMLTRKEARLSDVRRGLVRYYLSHPASLARRVGATLRYGFSIHYLTVAWQSPSDPAA